MQTIASSSPNHVDLLEQKNVDLGKQIQELKLQINHLSSAQGEEAEIQYKMTVEKFKTVRLDLESRVQEFQDLESILL